MSRLKRIAIAAVMLLALTGFGAAGCGGEKDHSEITEGEGFEMGELRFTVLYDRALNGAQIEDGPYLEGAAEPPADSEYFGVFLIVKNETGDPVPAPGISSFEITDTTETRYEPIALENDFVFPFGTEIEGESEVPDPDSIAASGPTQGALLLYLLPDTVSENRPLEMRIRYLGEEATVKLDV